MNRVDYKKVTFDAIYEENDGYIVSNHAFNGVLKINKLTNRAEFLFRFEDEESNQLALHNGILKYGIYLIFVPDNAKTLQVYDTESKKVSSYMICDNERIRGRCISAIIDYGKLWLFFAYPEHPTIIFDLETFDKEEFWGISEVLPPDILERKKAPVFWTPLRSSGKKVYGVIWNAGYIVEVDVTNRNVNIFTVQDKMNKLTALACNGDDLWLLEARNKTVMKWSIEKGIQARYTVAPEYLQTQSNQGNILIAGNKTIVLFDDCDYVFYVDEHKNEIEVLCEFPGNFKRMDDVRKDWRRFFGYEVIGNIVRMYPTNANMMLEIDVNRAMIKGYQFLLDDKYDECWYQKTIVNTWLEETYSDKCFVESEKISLDEYIKYVVSKD